MGATATAVVAGGGTVVATPTLTSGGTPSAISPTDFLTAANQIVNGVSMVDIGISATLKRAIAVGYNPSLGEFPLFYTEPARNVNNQADLTSWDVYGQSTFTIKLVISPNLVSPSIVGETEFDYQRNLIAQGDKLIPFLQPIAQHDYSIPIAAGVTSINTIPFDFPILRLWLQGSTADSITNLEVIQDGNKVFEGTIAQLHIVYEQYGFQFGKPNWMNTTYSGSSALKAAYQEPIYFDGAFIADPDQNWFKALTAVNSLVIKVTSSVAQTLTVTSETLPGNYAS